MPEYDLAVVGAGLGGLAAAALAAKQNKKAIILEPGDSVGGALGGYEKNGFSFSPGPTLSYGFERGGPLQKLSESLGIALNASVLSPCYQVAFPDRRITVYAEQSGTLEELRREFAGEIDSIAKFYRDLRKESLQIAKSRFSAYWASHRSADGFIRKYRFSRAMTAFLEVQSLFFFHRPVAHLSLATLVTLCDSAPLTVHGGFIHLAEQMMGVLLKNGGVLRHNVPFTDISFQGGQSVVLATPQGSLGAGTVLLNTAQQEQRPILYCGLREGGVPVGMSSNVLCLADYAHPEQFFAVSLGSGENGTAAPMAMRTLSVSTFSGKARQDSDDLKKQVGALMPFLDQFLVFSEEHRQASRSFSIPADLSFKQTRSGEGRDLLSRSSRKGVFLLNDGIGTPAQTISAAQTFMERFR